ncbi:MAG: rod shape-determining protein MreC, partial [Candidatus Margulisbacteria bacterium]|nr:rod shape-determining protein MreC [Candidatus Margulisiibacteriota bacterium]
GLFVWRAGAAVPASINNLRQLSRESHELRVLVEHLKLEQLTLEELKKENQRLRESLSFINKNPYDKNLKAARVVGRSPSPWFSILEVDQGSLAGVVTGLAVVEPAGVVGRVVEVSKLSAKVMIILDPASSVAAENQRSRDYGIVTGRSSNTLFMKYVSAGSDIKPGDQIVSSRISGVFPAGVPIGRVTIASKKEHDLFYQIEVKTAVDFSKLEEVYIIF